jgi:hypothetical protein
MSFVDAVSAHGPWGAVEVRGVDRICVMLAVASRVRE